MISLRIRAALATGIVVLLSPGWPAAQEHSSQEVLDRATRYVQEFMQRLSSVVAEERFVQETVTPSRRRELKSDFLLVTPPGSTDWFQFRDVFDVDGTPIRDREERLTKLFLEPSSDAPARAAAVGKESARYNLVDVGTINMPLAAIAFLQPRYREAFQFTARPIDSQAGSHLWVFEYQERSSPTVFNRGRDKGDLPARGRLWVDELTGRVAKTELLLDDGPFPYNIVTTFRFAEEFGINVPVEMRVAYGFGNQQMTGIATYGRFRRFGVQAEEKFQPIGSNRP